MQTVIVHIANEDPVVCEIDQLPAPTAQMIFINNPRKRDGMDVHYIDEDVTMLIVPVHRINFIQVLPAAGEEDVIGFVRE